MALKEIYFQNGMFFNLKTQRASEKHYAFEKRYLFRPKNSKR